MSKTIAITALEIALVGATVRLSRDQARELRDILDEAFPKTITRSPYWPISSPYPSGSFPGRWINSGRKRDDGTALHHPRPMVSD